MPGGILSKLTDKEVKAFVSKGEPNKKLADGGGLYLHKPSSGTPNWRIKYRLAGKERTYSLGPYPIVSLAAARTELIHVKRLLLENRDPVSERRLNRAHQISKTENTFLLVAKAWLAMRKQEWKSVHYEKSARALERDVYPTLGNLPISGITPAMVATTVEEIKRRGVIETASRILQHINGIFRYAQAKGLCRDNPAAPVREILPKKRSHKRMPAFVTFAEVGEILRKAEIAHLTPPVRMAHRLCAFTGARISNIVDAKWQEFQLDGNQPVWVIPKEKLKNSDSHYIDHRIPLCPEFAQELQVWRNLIGRRGYVFPSSENGKHISRESVEKAYRETLGLRDKHAPHGWRSSLSTLTNENGFDSMVVELAICHVGNDGEKIARIYDRGERFDQRIKMFDWWGKNLLAAQKGKPLIPSPFSDNR